MRRTPALSGRAKQSNDGAQCPRRRPPIDLQGLSLAELQRLIDERRLPPVDQWNPERCGHSEMRIARDGTWYHEGAPIRRPAMVRLFSTVLRREPDGRHVLVTPVEKLEIEVEATAFRAVEMTQRGRRARAAASRFRLDSGDAVILGPDHPLTIVDTGTALARASPSATGSRPSLRGRSITSSPRSRWPKATTRPACGATAPSSRWTRPMTLADRLRARARRRPPTPTCSPAT